MPFHDFMTIAAHSIHTVQPVFGNLSLYCLAFFIFAAAELVYVAFGFGAGLLAVGSLALVLPNMKDVIVILYLVNIPVELSVIYSTRKQIVVQGLGSIIIGVIVGLILGTGVLKNLYSLRILQGLGAFLTLSGILFACYPQSKKTTFPRGTGEIVGLLSGFLSGLFGTGGPPLIYYFQLKGLTKAAFRSTLLSLFFIISVCRFPIYFQADLLTIPRFMAALTLVPAVIIGAIVGNKVHLEIRELTFKRAVGVILAILGFKILLLSQ